MPEFKKNFLLVSKWLKYYLRHCLPIIQVDNSQLRPLEDRERQELNNFSKTFAPYVDVPSLIIAKRTALGKSSLFFMSAW